ncbi:DUF192 domain-containing protein [Uliginosibacterium paludis]|uniref:DUF192 domain-containing protein n=1 Tax=Uliginosibacterium paludis TaxID=1615952 RepID=A0ABV2CR42_9RHOO
MFRSFVAFALCAASFLAQAQQPPLRTVELRAGMFRIEAEVAATEAARETGLMNRKTMAQHQGMLFVFETSQEYCFWMKNTPLPLSIAFMDETGRIVNTAEMQPMSEANHCAAKPVRYALEMNQGWFSAKGIKPGSVIGGVAGVR